jgi:hypothetical protein
LADQVEKGNVVVDYCPTNEMIGDFMSKPLQGKLFQKFKNLIMGQKCVSTPTVVVDRSVLEDSKDSRARSSRTKDSKHVSKSMHGSNRSTNEPDEPASRSSERLKRQFDHTQASSHGIQMFADTLGA